MFHFTALVTCLAVLFYFFTTIQVSKARAAYGIKVPAVAGNADFERVFRVQMNTLEWMPIFLPSLWLFAIYISDAIAAVLGLVWIAGRILYMTGYSQAAAKRGRSFEAYSQHAMPFARYMISDNASKLSAVGPGCVKTQTSNFRVESLSRLR
jgi:glutathione S-transferase